MVAQTTCLPSMMVPYVPNKILLKTVNPHITCNLCRGYLIDATTIVECLHSFCHSCIMKHLRSEQYCPQCEMMINKAKPNIKPDATLQAMVYKLVPGLYEKELLRKRAFYKLRPNEAMSATPEQRGDDTEHLIFSPTEKISLSLEYADVDDVGKKVELKKPKYLQCPAIFKVANLKKFVLYKYGINSNYFHVEIMYKVKTIVLPDHYTLMDVAYIYTWKRETPMRYYYRIRTNEMKSDELPEVPLRRSPSISTNRLSLSVITEEQKETLSVKDKEIVPIVPSPITLASPTSKITSPSADKSVKTDLAVKLSPKTPKPSGGLPTEGSIKLKIERTNSNESKTKIFQSYSIDSSKKSDTPKSAIQKEANKKCESIKLKIDLSKNNSVSIISPMPAQLEQYSYSSKAEKKEKKKKLKLETLKELSPRIKEKKEKSKEKKESKKVHKKEHKHKDETKSSPVLKVKEMVSPVPKPVELTAEEDTEVKKNEFFTSLQLLDKKLPSPQKTPTKVLVASPSKLLTPPKAAVKPITSPSMKSLALLAPQVAKPTLTPSPVKVKQPSSPTTPKPKDVTSPMPVKSTSSKRKNKEPTKNVMNVKRNRYSDEEMKAMLEKVVQEKAAENKTENCLSFAYPIAPKTPISQKSSPTASPTKEATEANKTFLSSSVPKPEQQTFLAPNTAQNNFKKPSQVSPRPVQGIPAGNMKRPALPVQSRQPTPPKKLPRILPKAPEPQVKLPIIAPKSSVSDIVNSFNMKNDTEITKINRSLTNLSSAKVYGPDLFPTLPVHLPTASKLAKNVNKANNLSNILGKNVSQINMGLNRISTPYGTPRYTPNSPIYSPNSPSYTPNYNTKPQFKYTNPTAYAAYLHNMINRQDGSSLYTRNGEPKPSRKRALANLDKTHAPAEKQKKVQSLLDKINLPSSLSITIATDQDDPANNLFSAPKRTSPVNNYIEIVKLPENNNDNVDNSNEQKSIVLIDNNSKTGEHLQNDLLAKVNELNRRSTPSPEKTVQKLSPGKSDDKSKDYVIIIESETEDAGKAASGDKKSFPTSSLDKPKDSFQLKFLESILENGKEMKKVFDLKTTKVIEEGIDQPKGDEPVKKEHAKSPVPAKQEKPKAQGKLPTVDKKTSSPPLYSFGSGTSAAMGMPNGKAAVSDPKKGSPMGMMAMKPNHLSSGPSKPSKEQKLLTKAAKKPTPPKRAKQGKEAQQKVTTPNPLLDLSFPSASTIPEHRLATQMSTYDQAQMANYLNEMSRVSHSNGFMLPGLNPAYNANFSLINIQQALWMEQIKRMQKGQVREALDSYMQTINQNNNNKSASKDL